MGRRHKDIEPTVAQAGFHTVLPALIGHGQQLAEDLRIRCHAAAFQLGVHGIPHFGGGIAVGVQVHGAAHDVGRLGAGTLQQAHTVHGVQQLAVAGFEAVDLRDRARDDDAHRIRL
mgnify:CR=1 FL=1